MGVSMLDSEDSSSSVASGIVLAVSVSADENSNDTSNLDVSQLCQQRRNNRLTDTSLDKSNDNNVPKTSLTETGDAKNAYGSVHRVCNSHSIDVYNDDEKQPTRQRVISDKHLPQHKKIAILGAGAGIIPAIISNTNSSLPTGTGIAYKSTRSPLATVTCNNYTGSGGKLQQVKTKFHIREKE